MDRVHSTCVHPKRNGILEGVHLGEGGRLGIAVFLLIANYKIFSMQVCRNMLRGMYAMVAKDLSPVPLCIAAFGNGVRWICAYYYVGYISRRMLGVVLSIGVAVEAVIYGYSVEGFAGIVLRYLSMLQLMKMVSYVVVNREYAILGKDDLKFAEPVLSPTIPGFIIYPTLCYQMHYPASPERSYFNMFVYLLLAMPSSIAFYWTLTELCYNACLKVLHDGDFDAYLDVIIWVNAGWVSGFVVVFISFFGIQGEISRFGDKKFFGAWWDTTVLGYWRRWNSMIHMWIKRHVYKALLKKNITQRTSKLAIFLFSGVVHEYIIGNCVKRRGIGFLVMFLQMPLDYSVHHICVKLRLSPNLASFVVFNLLGAPAVALIATFAVNRK